MPDALLRPLIWLDFRLAVLFTVFVPLTLLLWAFVQRSNSIYQVLAIYWKVASLLAITVYLMIAALPISFLTAVAARVLIPLGLWFWVDLNDDIADLPRWQPLRLAFTTWRWAMTVYCALGVVFSGWFGRCGLLTKTDLLQNPQNQCHLWLEPPYGFKQMFHGATDEATLGFVGIVGLVLYVVALAYFVFVRLGKQGRTAIRL